MRGNGLTSNHSYTYQMSTTIVPHNQAMRLGQVCETARKGISSLLINPKGYNTYLQQICIDRAVIFVQEAVQTGVPSSPQHVESGPNNCTAQEVDTGVPQVCALFS